MTKPLTQRDRIIAAADGTRTLREVAELVGMWTRGLRTEVHHMRRQGIVLRFKRHDADWLPVRQAILVEMDAGQAAPVIALKFGVTRETVSNVIGYWRRKARS